MNACLQCLLPIDELRDYYMKQEFSKFDDVRTLHDSNQYSRMISEFFNDVFDYDSSREIVLNPTGLKNLIRTKFYPTLQHDSHEFFVHLLSQLQDEETPVNLPKFDGDITFRNKDRSL